MSEENKKLVGTFRCSVNHIVDGSEVEKGNIKGWVCSFLVRNEIICGKTLSKMSEEPTNGYSIWMQSIINPQK